MFINANSDGSKVTRAKLITQSFKIKCLCLSRVKSILMEKGNPKSMYYVFEVYIVCVMLVVFQVCINLQKTKALYNAYKFIVLMCFHSNRMRIWSAS